MSKYINLQDWRHRMRGVVASYKGKPVYVRDFRERGGEISALLYSSFRFTGDGLTGSAELIISASCDDFTFKLPAFGWTNHGEGKVTFSYRLCRREWRQGLRHEGLRVFSLNDANINGSKFLYNSETVLNCWKEIGAKPLSISSCQKILTEGEFQAFNRFFAVNGQTGAFYHKTSQVGSLSLEKGLKISPKYSYLVDELERLKGGEDLLPIFSSGRV